jgi:hypothetical protein
LWFGDSSNGALNLDANGKWQSFFEIFATGARAAHPRNSKQSNARTSRPRFNYARQFAEVFSAKHTVFMRHLPNSAIFILTGIGVRD